MNFNWTLIAMIVLAVFAGAKFPALTKWTGLT